jgi:hypothetical protein
MTVHGLANVEERNTMKPMTIASFVVANLVLETAKETKLQST